MQARQLMVLSLLALSACDKFAGPAGEQGPPGPVGPRGYMGPGGTVIRFIDSECRGPCAVACEENERILNTYAFNPGGTFIWEDINRATFRPQQQGAPTKVSIACVPK
jgi:hypothetical protein